MAKEFGCDEKIIVSKGRKKNMPRDMAIYLARDLIGESGVKLGESFGRISGSGITVRYINFLSEVRKTPKLKERVDRLRSRIINN